MVQDYGKERRSSRVSRRRPSLFDMVDNWDGIRIDLAVCLLCWLCLCLDHGVVRGGETMAAWDYMGGDQTGVDDVALGRRVLSVIWSML